MATSSEDPLIKTYATQGMEGSRIEYWRPQNVTLEPVSPSICDDTISDFSGTKWIEGSYMVGSDRLGGLVRMLSFKPGSQVRIASSIKSHIRGDADNILWQGTFDGKHVDLEKPTSAYAEGQTIEESTKDAAAAGWSDTFRGEIDADGKRIFGKRTVIMTKLNRNVTDDYELNLWTGAVVAVVVGVGLAGLAASKAMRRPVKPKGSSQPTSTRCGKTINPGKAFCGGCGAPTPQL